MFYPGSGKLYDLRAGRIPLRQCSLYYFPACPQIFFPGYPDDLGYLFYVGGAILGGDVGIVTVAVALFMGPAIGIVGKKLESWLIKDEK